MNYRREGHAAIKLDNGQVLIMGGKGYHASKPLSNKSIHYVYEYEIYDPKTGKFEVIGKYPEELDGIPYDYKLLPNNKVFITALSHAQRFGPEEGKKPPSDAYIYDMNKNTHTSVGLHQQERPGAAVFLSKNKEEVLFISGTLFKSKPDSGKKYQTDTINKLGENVLTPQGCEVISLVDSSKNRLLPCLASYKFLGVQLNDGSVFYPSLGTGMMINPTFTKVRWVKFDGIPRWNFNDRNDFPYYKLLLLKSGKILILGGIEYKSRAWETHKSFAVEVYDPKTETTKKVGEVRYRRNRGHTLTLLNDGSALIVGGHGDSRRRYSWKEFFRVKEAELYIGERHTN